MATASNRFKLIGPSNREWYNDSAVTLSCRLSPEISAVDLEIRWFKETDCVCVYKNSKVTEGRGYKGRVSLFTQELERGNVSLQLRNCTESDDGYYLCQVTDGDRTEEITVEMNEFKLIGPSNREWYNPSAVTLSCRLSPEISAVDLEIRWFKETDCVCVYKNNKVTEGRGYEGRVSLFTQELERGNVSLQLRNCTESDDGYYLCQVTDGDRTEEITVEMNEFKLIGPSNREWYSRSAVTLSCRLSPEISAVDLEIRWFKETDCVCVYKNSKVKEGRGYEGRVSLFTQELERGNVSLQLRNCTRSDGRYYLCQVTDGDRTGEITVYMSEFKLIGPSNRERYNRSAVTLSCRLSPEISAVDLEIRWFKETDCVCVYKNSKVTEGRGYEGRVSLFTQELERGNVSLQLRNCTESDDGDYLCQVTDGDRTGEITVEMSKCS
ncbi:hypothetical protein Q7C36_022862 [Tachysurus vachellii]|uniref:Ig-like domain-containing protein n=1 Tax=Tachysurus vachellii TaxID=175792 RepID=A0AA88IM86_TACVA|nr:hypothetical protein Q7C36_022862 [Tachysurus vachellii]